MWSQLSLFNWESSINCIISSIQAGSLNVFCRSAMHVCWDFLPCFCRCLPLLVKFFSQSIFYVKSISESFQSGRCIFTHGFSKIEHKPISDCPANITWWLDMSWVYIIGLTNLCLLKNCLASNLEQIGNGHSSLLMIWFKSHLGDSDWHFWMARIWINLKWSEARSSKYRPSFPASVTWLPCLIYKWSFHNI